jgi:hypothetical protein
MAPEGTHNPNGFAPQYESGEILEKRRQAGEADMNL